MPADDLDQVASPPESTAVPEESSVNNTSSAAASCLQLALVGERHCLTGDCRQGIALFLAALEVGTDDLQVLSAIYSQLGNAYFYQRDYFHALEYHRWDLTLARRMHDSLGEAKASGNLGNALKMLGKYDEAIICCQRQLDICQSLNETVYEARALYNLANAYHAKGKQYARFAGPRCLGELTLEAKEAQRDALLCYEKNLELVRQLGDRSAEGRALGNVGNTYYLLGEFSEAIKFHTQRLQIAKEFGDKCAQRRAYSNIGNTYVFLADYMAAAKAYRRALRISRQLNDLTLQAQACYSLGNCCTVLREYPAAVVYHLRHLAFARTLSDQMGEGRAYWSLANAYAALKDYPRAIRCSLRHRQIAIALGDESGLVTADVMLRELRSKQDSAEYLDTESPMQPSQSQAFSTNCAGSVQAIASDNEAAPLQNLKVECLGDVELEEELALATAAAQNLRKQRSPYDSAAAASTFEPHCDVTSVNEGAIDEYDDNSDVDDLFSLDESELIIIDGSEKPAEPLRSSEDQSSEAGHIQGRIYTGHDNEAVAARAPAGETGEVGSEADFFDLLVRSQSQRMDEQRCPLVVAQRQPADAEHSVSSQEDAFFELLAGIQGSRMNDQRADLPEFPGFRVDAGLPSTTASQAVASASCQLRRLQSPDSAMATLAPQATAFLRQSVASDGLTEYVRQNNEAVSSDAALGVVQTSDDALFDMILRLQESTRMDDQRANLPEPTLTVEPPANRSSAPTVPDEDLFSLIQRVQSTRLDEQRCSPPVLANREQRTAAQSIASTVAPQWPRERIRGTEKPVASTTATTRVATRSVSTSVTVSAVN